MKTVPPRGAGMATESLIEAVRYYRRLEFFREYSDLPDEALGQRLEALVENEWGETFTTNDTGLQVVDEWGETLVSPENVPLAELTLLRADSTRVWWEDTEADVCRENQVYVETLRAWAGI